MEAIESRGPKLSLLTLLFAVVLAAPAGATFVHGSFSGTNVNFIGVQETTQTVGDPEPLFGTPTVVGNVMTFDPPSFLASTAGGGFDADHATLQMDIEAAGPLDTIDIINLTELGDVTLTGGASTGVVLSMAGTIRVNATTAGVITPVSTTWVGTFNTGDVLSAISHPGTTGWIGSASIDVTAILAAAGIFDAATSVTLSFNNHLQAFSEAGLSSATVQKKAVDGPAVIVEVIPEPATGALLALGLTALGIRSRRRRV